MRVELLEADKHAEKYKKKNETKREYLKRFFKASYQVLYRKNKYIAKDKDGNLALYHKVEDGKK